VNPILGRAPQLLDLVVDLLDVRFRPRRRHDLGAVVLDLLEALGAHLLG
jgi:hypothetical protein